MVRLRDVPGAGDQVARLVNQPEAPVDLGDAFSGWAEIFAEPAGRSLALTCARSCLGSCTSHPLTAIAGSASDGIIEVPKGILVLLFTFCSEDTDLQFPADHLAKAKSQM